MLYGEKLGQKYKFILINTSVKTHKAGNLSCTHT